MVFDKMYEQNHIVSAALNAASLRNEVINNNLANADVPGYKAKKVNFENSLQKAIDRRDRTGIQDLSDVSSTITFVNENYSYRIDQNNVDVETEMVDLYQNSIKFEALMNCASSNSKRLNLALTGR